MPRSVMNKRGRKKKQFFSSSQTRRKENQFIWHFNGFVGIFEVNFLVLASERQYTPQVSNFFYLLEIMYVWRARNWRECQNNVERRWIIRGLESLYTWKSCMIIAINLLISIKKGYNYNLSHIWFEEKHSCWRKNLR